MTTGLAGCTAPTGDTIKIGTLLPQTGGLANFGPDMQRGAELAVEHINSAGGVLGSDIEIVPGDSRTDPGQAPQEFQRLLDAGVVAVVGAASSGVTGSVIGRAVDNQVVLVTPASTSPTLTDRDNKGFFFRVPPDDGLQGKVMAQLLDDNNVTTFSTLYVNNDYGQGFNNVLRTEAVARYQMVPLSQVAFDDKASSFDSEVQQVGTGDPDAIVYIGYPGTGVPIVRKAAESGALERHDWFFSEGVYDQKFVDDVGTDESDMSLIAGRFGTTPQPFESSATGAFKQSFEAAHGHAPGLFAAESYDAVMAIAYAIVAANSADPVDFKATMLDTWNSPGPKVEGADGLSRVADGQDVDYKGASGDFNWDTKGDPVSGIYAVWTVTEDGKLQIAKADIEV